MFSAWNIFMLKALDFLQADHAIMVGTILDAQIHSHSWGCNIICTVIESVVPNELRTLRGEGFCVGTLFFYILIQKYIPWELKVLPLLVWRYQAGPELLEIVSSPSARKGVCGKKGPILSVICFESCRIMDKIIR